MNFLGLTDDAILHIVKLLQDDPLLGLMAVVGLHRSQHRLRTLLQTLTSPKELLERARRVSFHWELLSFSSVRAHSKEVVIRSQTFCTGLGHSFRLMVFPNGNEVPFLSVYLEVVSAELFARGWSRRAKFTLTINTAKHHERCHDAYPLYTETTPDWGYRELFPLDFAENFLSEDDVLQMSVDVVVEPPPLSFFIMKSVLQLQRNHIQLLRNVLPLMIRDLQRVLEFNANGQWLKCPECDGLITGIQMPKHGATRTRSDRHLGTRVRCSTEGCKSCPVPTAHAMLRSVVAENSTKTIWYHWCWPTVWSAVKPEDFFSSCITSRSHDLVFQHNWRDVMHVFAVDLDKCLTQSCSQLRASCL